jgi:hypothetical protein
VTWLLDTSYGITYDAWTLPLGLALTVAWVLSARVLPGAGTGWRAVPTSLLGWSWVGFGLAFVARFWVLSIDAVTYGDLSERLIAVPASTINEALMLAGLYWITVTAVFWLIRPRVPRLNPLESIGRVVGQAGAAAFDAAVVVAVVAMLLQTATEWVPVVLTRPLGLITSLWAVAATAAWAISLRTAGERFGVRRWIYLLPGLVAFFIEPFRERLLLMLLVPLVAALFAGRRLRLAVVFGAFIVFGLASTIAVSWYRQIVWEGQTVRESSDVIDPQLWLKEPYLAPWTAVLRRFHSFDSLVFYVNLVPEVVGFESDRNPLVDVALEGFIPRALYPEKPESRRAMLFSTTLWGYSDVGRAESNIAPSMAGDLYGAGGWQWVLIGAACWGLLLGLLDGWSWQLSPSARAVIIASLALLAAGGIERDFPRAVATLLQNAIVLVGFAMLLVRALGLGPVRRDAARAAAIGADLARQPAASP